MNLFMVTAVIAVCGAAKLDRTYLPPSSAVNAGGSPGSLQAPLIRSSVQGLETPRLPSGSYTNEFGGVVVDAASPGTRASVDADQSNLGGPRQSYGSTDSKVGDAAFRGTAGFRDVSFGSQGQSVAGSPSSSQIDAHNGQFPSQNRNNQFSNEQVSNFENKSERPQAAKDRNSNILALSNDVESERYSYGFETNNGIAVGENGVAVNGIQAEGGYSYQGDDGQVYKVTYTADEGGYRPQGAHLPTPPPIPEEILKSLEQNAKEEAAGIVDDGSYDAQKYNTEGDYTNDNSGTIQHNGGQLTLFAKRPESNATASSSLINQNGQAFRQPGFGQINSNKQNSNFNGKSGQSNRGSGQFEIDSTQISNFALNGQSSQGNRNSAFEQFSSQSALIADMSQTNERPGQFGFGPQRNQQSSQGNRQSQKDASSSQNSGNFQNIQVPGNLMPSSSPQIQSTLGGINHFGSQALASAKVQNQSPNSESQQKQQGFNTQLSSGPTPVLTQPQFGSSFKPQGSEAFSGASLDQEHDGQDFGKPFPETFSGPNFNRPNTPTEQLQANKFVSGTNNFNKLSQLSQITGKNEYLPPNAVPQEPEQIQASHGFNSNVGRPDSFTLGSNLNRQISAVNKPTPNFMPLIRQNPSLASNSASTSFVDTTFRSQPVRQIVESQSSRFGQQNQFSSQNPQLNANFEQAGSFSQNSQEQSSFGIKPTSIPDTELTTPLEPHETPAYSKGSQLSSQTTPSLFDSKLASNTEMQAQYSFQGNYAFGKQSSQPLSPSFSTSTPSALQSSSSGGSNPSKSFNKLQPSQNSFGQQQSSSSQVVDSSYYYNQPSQPFGLTANRPQAPRFPSSSSYQSNVIVSPNTQQRPFSGKLPGSNFISSVVPTAASQFNQQQNYNGITQAAISSFPSPSPTPTRVDMAQNNQLGSKPIQQSFVNQAQTSKLTFNQQNTFENQFRTSASQLGKPSFSHGQTGFPSRPVQYQHNPSPGFQTQNKFGQSGQFEQSQNTPGFSEQSSEDKPTVTQQYQGTIYEYNKPAQVLPASTQTDSSSSQSIQSGVAIETQPSFSQQSNQQNRVNESVSKPNVQIKPFGSGSAIQLTQQVNKFGSQSGPTNNQFSNTAQTSQFASSAQQQNVQGSQQPFKPFGFNNNQSPFGTKSQPGFQTTQLSQNMQTDLNAEISQPSRGSSQSKFGTSPFGNIATGQNNGYSYPNPTSKFPDNPQMIIPQQTLSQNTQNPFAQALFTVSQQTTQSQFNSNSAPELSAQSSQLGQSAFIQKSPHSPIQSFGQSTASSQAVASGEAMASASASLQQPHYKPFASQDRNQFSLNKNDAQGQSTQHVAVQNLQTVGSSKSDDSLKPYGALSSRPETSTAELPKPLFSSACCQASKDSTPAQSADASSQSGVQFRGVQNFNPQSFAGQGEEFGGPRQPPKFDKTGYHY